MAHFSFAWFQLQEEFYILFISFCSFFAETGRGKQRKEQERKGTHLGGAQSCLVQSSRVPTYVLFLHVTLTTRTPVRERGVKGQHTFNAYYFISTSFIVIIFTSKALFSHGFQKLWFAFFPFLVSVTSS